MKKMRQIVLDTETTGLDPTYGHRLVEIGCIELINYLPSGSTYHTYINPERDVPKEAAEVHGLKQEFLKDFPIFKEIHSEFLDFIADSELIIHNAPFDMKFLNAELKSVSTKVLSHKRVIDTLKIARKKFPGSPASLDALCKRFGIDNSSRDLHGALLDSKLLAEVYLELVGGRQPGFSLEAQSKATFHSNENNEETTNSPQRSQRSDRKLYTLTNQEKQAHEDFMTQLKKVKKV